MDQSKTKYQSDLRAKIAEHFSTEEINVLAFDLGIQPDQLSGTARDSKSLSLVSQLARQGRLEELVDQVRKKRSKVDWPDVPAPNQQKKDELNYIPEDEQEQKLSLPVSQLKKVALKGLQILVIALLVWGTFQLGRWSSETRTGEVTREVTRIIQQEVEVEVTRNVPVEVTRLVEAPVEVTRIVEVVTTRESDNIDNSPTEVATSTATTIPTPAETNTPAPTILIIDGMQASPESMHGPDVLRDGKVSGDLWAPEFIPGQTWLKVLFREERTIERIGMYADPIWARPKQISITFADGSVQTGSFRGLDGWEYVELEPVVSEEFTISIVEIYPGTSIGRIGVYEIQVYGH